MTTPTREDYDDAVSAVCRCKDALDACDPVGNDHNINSVWCELDDLIEHLETKRDAMPKEEA